MKNKSTKMSKIKKVSVVDLIRLAEKYREAQMKRIADWYDTSNSSCARTKGAGNGL